ncbi:hypothetical protein [Paraburkholderia sp. RL17-337-BIB-A]|uniref:hypothetical protein n=1 Tax=Paraburkholderia sp. RL17-337-BIB-A TaxID=3031636 RepID=UPI0038BA343B
MMKRLSHSSVNKAILSCCYIPIVRWRPFVSGLNAIYFKGVHRIIWLSACVERIERINMRGTTPLLAFKLHARR